MNIGERVRVVQIVEQDILLDGDNDTEFGAMEETSSSLRRMLRFVGRIGRVVELRTREGQGIGERPGDPLRVVRFRRRTRRSRATDEVFWSEELKRVRR